MFRKLINIIVTFLLLTVTAGFTVSKHYCGNTMVAVAIDHNAHCHDMDDNNSCCHTETRSYQLHENYVVSPSLESNNVASFDLFITEPVFIETIFNEQDLIEVLIPESPPPKTLHTQLSSLQTFLMYDT